MLSYETSWGNPKITKQLIDKVIQSGFNLIRISVNWRGDLPPCPYHHFKDAPNYLNLSSLFMEPFSLPWAVKTVPCSQVPGNQENPLGLLGYAAE